MSHEDDELERDLRALFDATAEPLAGPSLTRVSARAAEVPGRARAGWRRFAWSFLPAACVAAGALVAVMLGRAAPDPPTASGGPTVLGSVSGAGAVAPASPAVVPLVEGPPEVAFEEAWSDEDDGFGAAPPSEDQELEAWALAAESLLGGGG